MDDLCTVWLSLEDIMDVLFAVLLSLEALTDDPPDVLQLLEARWQPWMVCMGSRRDWRPNYVMEALLTALAVTGCSRGRTHSFSRCYWMPCRPVEAVVGVLLDLLLLLDALSASGGRRGRPTLSPADTG